MTSVNNVLAVWRRLGNKMVIIFNLSCTRVHAGIDQLFTEISNHSFLCSSPFTFCKFKDECAHVVIQIIPWSV